MTFTRKSAYKKESGLNKSYFRVYHPYFLFLVLGLSTGAGIQNILTKQPLSNRVPAYKPPSKAPTRSVVETGSG